jgi:hypothetical protein
VYFLFLFFATPQTFCSSSSLLCLFFSSLHRVFFRCLSFSRVLNPVFSFPRSFLTEWFRRPSPLARCLLSWISLHWHLCLSQEYTRRVIRK